MLYHAESHHWCSSHHIHPHGASAGNTVLLKHSSQTPLVAERFAECFKEAGLPDGVFQVWGIEH